ncbi:MAG TPA: FAD:protein FMN transferase [Rectinemataceae bacterium]
MKRFFTAVFAALALSGAIAAEISRSDMVLGTVCSLRIIEGGSSKTVDEVFRRLSEIESRMSANKDGTEIAAINAAAGKQAVKVSPDTFYVITKALEYAKLSKGAFDPSVGPLVKLWGIGTDEARLPSKQEISAALGLIDYRLVETDAAKQTVKLLKPGMRLDLGAIAKGYAADEVSAILQRHKVKSAVVDLGGNVLVFGEKRDGSPWRVGVQDPVSERGEYLGLIAGKAMTVVTSGVYERYFIEQGIRYHHILDTKTGYPVKNGLVSVTIVASASIDADGLSTTVFALGLERGMALIESMPNVEAVFVDEQNRVYLSPGAEKLFTLTSKAYSLAR